MKKFKTIIFMMPAVVMCLSLGIYGCKATGTEQTIQDDQVKTKAPTTTGTPEGDVTKGTDAPDVVQFKGKIVSIDGDEAIVTPDEGEDIRRSSDAVRVNIAYYSKPLKAGDAVTIYYDGVIMDSYPLQINVLGINNEMFQIEDPLANPEALD